MKTIDVIVTMTAYTDGNPRHSMGTHAFKFDDGSIRAAVEINGVAAHGTPVDMRRMAELFIEAADKADKLAGPK